MGWRMTCRSRLNFQFLLYHHARDSYGSLTASFGSKWWFASIAIPLLAATIGPLANVLSIAALASKWRVDLPNNGQLPEGTDDAGVDIADPKWETILNAISLAVGVLGNLALMFNFTKRIRYIIALPLTIIAWYIATGIVWRIFLRILEVNLDLHVYSSLV